jgi:diguanylate cyclase (GGDEF)-like protein
MVPPAEDTEDAQAAAKAEGTSRLQDLLRNFRLEDILATSLHSQDFTFYRSDYLLVRVRLFALLFGIATPVWIPMDTLLLPAPYWVPMAGLRAVTGLAFLLLAFLGTRRRSLFRARLALLALISIPALFYLGSRLILGPQDLEGAMIGYRFLPFVLIAGGAIFPLALAEGIGIMVPVYATVLLVYTLFGELLDLRSLGTLWLMALLSGIALWAQSAQLYTLLGLYRQATLDPLTGLFNRRALFRQLKTELARAKRQDQRLSVLLFDLDHFKHINDVYGHPVGDEVLRHVASLLRQQVREEDIIGRYGGEEFIIIALDSDANAATVMAERIRHAVHQSPLPMASGELPLSTSVGVTQWEPDEDEENLMARVDCALYEAKDSGRDRVVTVDSSVDPSEHGCEPFAESSGP